METFIRYQKHYPGGIVGAPQDVTGVSARMVEFDLIQPGGWLTVWVMRVEEGQPLNTAVVLHTIVLKR
jgi:hypothetical protein